MCAAVCFPTVQKFLQFIVFILVEMLSAKKLSFETYQELFIERMKTNQRDANFHYILSHSYVFFYFDYNAYWYQYELNLFVDNSI